VKLFLALSSVFYSAFLFYNLYLDNSLITTRNNFLTLSIIFLCIGYLFKEKNKKNFLDFVYFSLGGIILVFLSYTAIVNFPTNDLINRNFLRTLHYFMLCGYILFYIKYAERSYLIPATFLIIVHSIFFLFNDYLSIYLFPYLLISISLEKVMYSDSKVSLSDWKISIFLFLILATIYNTKPASIQEFRAYALLITLIPIIIVIRNVPEYFTSKFLYLILIILIFQGIFLNINIVRDLLFIHQSIDPRSTVIGIPVSSIGSLGCLGFFISSSYILYPKQSRIQFILGLMLFILSTALLYFSYSRTSFLASIIVFISVFIMINKSNLKRIFKNKIIIIIGLVFIIISLTAFIQKSFELNTVHVRLSIWEFHLKSAFQSAPLFGLGMEPEWRMIYTLPKGLSNSSFNDMVEYLQTFRSDPIAHNLFVQTFSSFGILGTLIFIMFLLYLLVPNVKLLFKNTISLHDLLYFAVVIGVILHEITDVSILEHQILFPVLAIIVFLKPRTESNNNKLFNKINLILMVCLLFPLLTSILQINIMKIHKKDLKDVYSADNLMYLLEKESPARSVKWSYPNTDIIFKLMPEKNFYKLKYFYNIYKYKKSNDLAFLGSATANLKKCILLKPEEPLCIHYLAETIQYLEPEEFENITEFLYTIAKIQDPFHSISSINSNTKIN